MTQHTPGPWMAFEEGPADDRRWGIFANGIYITDSIYEEDNGEANAYLMAAAPDLLIALAQCEAQFRFYQSEHEKAGKMGKAATNKRFADLAAEAIKKATVP